MQPSLTPVLVSLGYLQAEGNAEARNVQSRRYGREERVGYTFFFFTLSCMLDLEYVSLCSSVETRTVLTDSYDVLSLR